MRKYFCKNCGHVGFKKIITETCETQCPKCKCTGLMIEPIPRDGWVRVQKWRNCIVESYDGGYFNDGQWVTIKTKSPKGVK